jgi:hypothetical protein
MKRHKPLSRRSRLRRASKIRQTQLRTYSAARLAFLREHLLCAMCGKIATEVHHKRGRIGVRLLDFEACLPLCLSCHRKIHDNPGWARSQGFLH